MPEQPVQALHFITWMNLSQWENAAIKASFNIISKLTIGKMNVKESLDNLFPLAFHPVLFKARILIKIQDGNSGWQTVKQVIYTRLVLGERYAR